MKWDAVGGIGDKGNRDRYGVREIKGVGER